LVDYRLIQTSLDRRGMPPGHSADAMVRADIEAALSPWDSREMHSKYPKARPCLIAERSSWSWANTRNGSGPRHHHCIKSSPRPADLTGDDGGVDAFGLLSPWSV